MNVDKALLLPGYSLAFVPVFSRRQQSGTAEVKVFADTSLYWEQNSYYPKTKKLAHGLERNGHKLLKNVLVD